MSRPLKPTSGPSTPMPSVKLDLGRYVTLRRRVDGTYRVLMEVPARLRPSGWSPAIPLPVKTERPDGTYLARKGDLSDELEIRAIREDAADLYRRLNRARIGSAPAAEAPKRDLPTLNRAWQLSQGFKAKKPRTQQGYAYHAGLIEDWSRASGHKPVAGLNHDVIERFLALYDDRPTTRRHVKIVLKMLLDHAIRLGWRTDNPAAHFKMKAPKSRLTLWEHRDVMAGAWACIMAGQAPLAALLLTEWEIGQRLTDTRSFRWKAEYQPEDGAFRFWQEKTQQYVTVPVSDALRGLLDCIYDKDSLFLFVDRTTGRPFTEQRLGHIWIDIRRDYDLNPALQVRALRHSCVVQLARAGVGIPGICSITGHTLKSAHQILETYLPKDNALAWEAQRKRGLIARAPSDWPENANKVSA